MTNFLLPLKEGKSLSQHPKCSFSASLTLSSFLLDLLMSNVGSYVHLQLKMSKTKAAGYFGHSARKRTFHNLFVALFPCNWISLFLLSFFCIILKIVLEET